MGQAMTVAVCAVPTGRGGRSWHAPARLALFVAALAAILPSTWGQSATAPATAPDLVALERAFQEVVQRVSPSVVGIRARRHGLATAPGVDGSLGAAIGDHLVVLNGSGTIIRDDGLILTNQHVIQGATVIEVVLFDGRVRSARVVGADARSDLAVLRVEADGLTAARFCDWDNVARGQWNIALGNPYGLGSDGHPSVSVGVIANLGRRLPGLGEADDRLYADMIQTTATIHPGYSGGPLFNVRGELLGVVTAVHTRSVDDEGAGFAIPMSPARRRVIERLLNGRPVVHGYLGLTVRALEATEWPPLRLNANEGVYVEQVDADGPATKAGVQEGDVITHFNGQSVDAPIRLAELVGQTLVGQNAELKLRRGTASLVLAVTVEARQPSRVSWLRSGAILWRGMRLTDLTPEARRRLKAASDATGVVVIDVRADSPAARARLQIGDVIEAVEDGAVRDVGSFLQAVRGQNGRVQLRVHGRGAVTISP